MIKSRPTDCFQIGDVLNNTHQIQEIIGRGGTGEVYKAIHLITEQTVAVKSIQRSLQDETFNANLMKREAAMRSIVHDAVVRYTDCSRASDGTLYLVMDFVSGPSLAQKMTDQIRERDLIIIGHRVLEGLSAIHDNGVIHRDISPDNIILREGEPSKATIIDFGIAKDRSENKFTVVGNQFAGKYEYAAPEQFTVQVEARSDLYSLGAVLLAAWRGHAPNFGESISDIAKAKSSPPKLDDVPEPLRGLIAKLMAPKPADRPESAIAAVKLFEAALSATENPEKKNKKNILRPALYVCGICAFLAIGLVSFEDSIRGWINPLPLAEPYEFQLKLANNHAMLSGHAPEEDALDPILSELSDFGYETEYTVIQAVGIPNENWFKDIADLTAILSSTDSAVATVSGLSVQIEAVSSSSITHEDLQLALDSWHAKNPEFRITSQLRAGPAELHDQVLRPIIEMAENCGPLVVSSTKESPWPLGAEIRVTGDLESATSREALRDSLESIIGDRSLRLDTNILNSPVCELRQLLPNNQQSTVSIWLGDGRTGVANDSGIYYPGDVPIVDVLMPETMSGYLWVIMIDVGGEAFHLLPNLGRRSHALDEIGQMEGGIRRVRILWSPEEKSEDPSRLMMQSNEEAGFSEIVALVTKEPLFQLRPIRESSTAVATALAEAIQSDDTTILGVARRLMATQYSP